MGIKGILLIVAGIIMLVGFVITFLGVAKKKRCIESGIATIVDIKRKKEDTDDKGNTSYVYRPVLEFKMGTETIRKAAGVSSSKRKEYRVGDKVNIMYNPLKPKEFLTKKQKTGVFTGSAIMVAAVAFAGLVLWLF